MIAHILGITCFGFTFGGYTVCLASWFEHCTLLKNPSIDDLLLFTIYLLLRKPERPLLRHSWPRKELDTLIGDLLLSPQANSRNHY